MGVSGSGKSTVGAALAERLGATFEDGDDLHSQANLDKMRAGVELTDEDRAPWLQACADWLAEKVAAGEPAVLACSALKHSYRDLLRAKVPDLQVVYLSGDRGLLESRLARRDHHFFPPSLLDSQLADLEPPGPDEDPITVSIQQPPAVLVNQIVQQLPHY